jgi:hypothetical protein
MDASNGKGATNQRCGAELIAIERARQINEARWTSEHDDKHTKGQLAMAAVCYASVERVYVCREYANGTMYRDPFPFDVRDKRFLYGERRNNWVNEIPDPSTYTKEERIDLLVKAGALIAAEIDRLRRT